MNPRSSTRRHSSAAFAALVGALSLFTSITATATPLADKGRAVMAAAECNRCHAISDVSGADRGIAPMERDRNCVDCHLWILSTRGDEAAIAEQRKLFPDWDRYLENIVHFRRLPDLGTLTRRVDPAFVRRFLDAPYDLRPHLDESMIPLRLSARDKDAVVAYLTELNGDAAVKSASAGAEPEVDAARIEAGRQVFLRSGCATCHVMGPEPLVPGFDQRFFAAMGDQARLAPDLRHVRKRVPRATMVRFIVDPKSVDPNSAMPSMSVSPADAERIADFLLHGPIADGPAPKPAMVEAKTLDRQVSWDEVYEEVLGFVCVHCHMAPESNNGDGGPGNDGGLGFAGVKLDLETYAGVKRGLMRGGKRVSIIEPSAAGEPPLLLAALLRRHAEAGRDVRPIFSGYRADARGPDPTRPGMPMGLPPLSVDKVRMIATWLAQGAPGPQR